MPEPDDRVRPGLRPPPSLRPARRTIARTRLHLVRLMLLVIVPVLSVTGGT
jgi:hypothetical protein